MKTNSYGETTSEEIIEAAQRLCPEGYHFSALINSQDAVAIRHIAGIGIDSHLQAITNSKMEVKFQDYGTRLVCLFSPEDLAVVCRRLQELEEQLPDMGAGDLRQSILQTLDIEEI